MPPLFAPPAPCCCCCFCCCFCSCCTVSRVAFVRGRRTPRYQVSLTRTPPDCTTFIFPLLPPRPRVRRLFCFARPCNTPTLVIFFPSSIFHNCTAIISRHGRATPCRYSVYKHRAKKNKVFAMEWKININRNLKPLGARAVT